MNFVQLYVQLDPRLREFVALTVTVVVSYLLLQLAKLVPALADYLGQYKVAIITWLTGVAVQLIQLELNKIPATWDEVAFAAMKLLVEVIIALGIFAGIRKAKVKGYLALQ